MCIQCERGTRLYCRVAWNHSRHSEGCPFSQSSELFPGIHMCLFIHVCRHFLQLGETSTDRVRCGNLG